MRSGFGVLLNLLMAVALAVQIAMGYSAMSFALGILFGGCFVMSHIRHTIRKGLQKHGYDPDHKA